MDTKKVQVKQDNERTFYVPLSADFSRVSQTDHRGFVPMYSGGRKRSIKMLDLEGVDA
jgi:hypothetical protein